MKFYWIFVIILFFPILNAKIKKNKKTDKEENFCVIREEEKQMKTFDFRNLSNYNVPDYNITVDEFGSSIDFQLCTPLRKKCNGQDGYYICLKKENKEIGIGKYLGKQHDTLKNFQFSFKYIGEKCNETSNYTTTILLQCDYNAIPGKSYPQVFPFVKDQCDIFLHWSTIYACGQKDEISCSVTDDSDYKYDLSNLTDFSNNYHVRVNDSLTILLNVCHSLILGHGVSCKVKTASCLISSNKLNDNGFALGDIQNPLSIIKEGLLRMQYNNGDICLAGSSNDANTVVDFICDHNVEDSSPYYVNGSENCNYYLEWRTPFACKVPLENKGLPSDIQKTVNVNPSTIEKQEVLLMRSTSNYQINCKLTTAKGEVDLTPLVLTNDDYVVKTKDSDFYINVCTPLVSTSKLTACQGSYACEFRHDKIGEISNATSLGSPSGNLLIQQGRNVVLQYKDGASCSENQRDLISTNVTFVCNYSANKGFPQFDKYKNCTYLFKWETKFVCDSVIGNFHDNCTIDNPLSRSIDLSVLRKRTFYVKTANEDKKYSINICGEKDICNGSTVCEGTNGYGSSINVVFEYPKDSVKLEFTKGSKCLNESAKSDITFICNSTANVGSPVLISETPISHCHPRFEWQTNVICPTEVKPSTSTENPVTSAESKDTEKEKDLTSSNGLIVALIVFGLTIIVLIVILLRNPSRRARCFRMFSNPCSSSSNDRVKYCRVNTTEEARLLLDNSDPITVCQSDSDDDLLGA